MGVVATIDAEHFPTQSGLVGERVELCFHYDTSQKFIGTVLRDDTQEPGETLIQILNAGEFGVLAGKIVRSVECAWRVI